MRKAEFVLVLSMACFCVTLGLLEQDAFAKSKTKTKPTRVKKSAARTKPSSRTPSKQVRPVPSTQKPIVRVRPPKNKAERIVEKMVVATGGRASWAHVKTIEAKGVTHLVTVLGEKKASITAYELRPTFQRLDMVFGGQTVTQSYYSKGGWMRQNGVIFQLPRSMLDMTKAEVSRANLELRYAIEPIQVKFLRARTIRNTMCNIIVFVDAKKRRTTYYITQKESMLLKRSYVGPSPLGTGKKRFSTYYGDFRWVTFPKSSKRVKIPFLVENYIGGRKVGTIRLSKVTLNSQKIQPKLFLPPSPVD